MKFLSVVLMFSVSASVMASSKAHYECVGNYLDSRFVVTIESDERQSVAQVEQIWGEGEELDSDVVFLNTRTDSKMTTFSQTGSSQNDLIKGLEINLGPDQGYAHFGVTPAGDKSVTFRIVCL